MVTIPRVTAGDDHVCGGGHGRLPAGSDVSDMFGVCRLRIIVILARRSCGWRGPQHQRAAGPGRDRRPQDRQHAGRRRLPARRGLAAGERAPHPDRGPPPSASPDRPGPSCRTHCKPATTSCLTPIPPSTLAHSPARAITQKALLKGQAERAMARRWFTDLLGWAPFTGASASAPRASPGSRLAAGRHPVLAPNLDEHVMAALHG